MCRDPWLSLTVGRNKGIRLTITLIIGKSYLPSPIISVRSCELESVEYACCVYAGIIGSVDVILTEPTRAQPLWEQGPGTMEWLCSLLFSRGRLGQFNSVRNAIKRLWQCERTPAKIYSAIDMRHLVRTQFWDKWLRQREIVYFLQALYIKQIWDSVYGRRVRWVCVRFKIRMQMY